MQAFDLSDASQSAAHKAPWECNPENIVPSPSRSGDPNYVADGGGAFRAAEKRYAGRGAPGKRKPHRPTVDLSNVLDFSNLDANTAENRAQIVEVQVKDEGRPPSAYFSAKPKMYAVKSVEGLYFIPNPFTADQQRYWVRRCVKDFTIGNPTNVSNLEAIDRGTQTLFTEWTPAIMENLRWSSLGYHYQWTPRVYTEEHRGKFPADLAAFVQDAAALLGHGDMRAEAAIINYYPQSKCVMGGHLDDAEEAMHKPIVSASFGNTIIFLIGGRTRDVEPTALYIRSGDIVLMSGHARYCYHGVPKMLPGTSPDYLSTPAPASDLTGESWPEDIAAYMKDARVNMNVRQVRIDAHEPALLQTAINAASIPS